MLNLISLLLFIPTLITKELSLTMNLHTARGDYYPNNLRNLQYSTPIYGNTSLLNYYYVNLYIGNPPKRQALIIDTGSLLTTIPCMPFCDSCGKHINSYYNFEGKIINT